MWLCSWRNFYLCWHPVLVVIIISTCCEGQHSSNFLTQCLFKKTKKQNKTKQKKKLFYTLCFGQKKVKFVKSSEWVNVSNWGLSHKGLGIRSVAEVAVLYLCTRAFQLLQRDRLRQRSTGLSVNPWQRQTGCTILWGRFNYKWCFHSEPSWNPLFFRRSSSPNPQKGLVWPASEVICLAHIVCHALWMMGKRHSCPNFAESSVNVKTWADRMLMFATERSGMEAGFYRALVLKCRSYLFAICACLRHLRLTMLHLCCPSLSVCLFLF